MGKKSAKRDTKTAALDKELRKKGKRKGDKKNRNQVEVAPVEAPSIPAVELFRLPDGAVQISALSTDRLPGGPADKEEALALMNGMAARLGELQERLFAASTAGGQRRVLLVLQGMDTSGKDGVIEHAMGLLNPSAVVMTSFKKPTPEELEHDFLWRIENRVPAAGYIGVFNRSHYEDVLIARVHNLVPQEVWSERYAAINAFERRLAGAGVTIVKCFLHISSDVQAERLAARLDDPTKYWKFNPGDIDERAYWSAYQEAYQAALTRCSTAVAPWYVIPSDHKWYRNWAVAALLLETLETLDPQYPPATYDVAEQKRRLAAQLGS
jgi:PPK2 family polyphosphate:nucleotide phosphotransferase